MIGIFARKFISSQIWLSKKLDSYLSKDLTKDGLDDFIDRLVPRYLAVNQRIYDLGSGKNPHIKLDKKQSIKATVVGLDIDGGELEKAPRGSYDETITTDISKYRGKGDVDLIISQTLLEHVADVEQAFVAMNSILKPGGKVVLYLPSRNAWFARLNMVLPEGLKRRILYFVYPETEVLQGFPAYYDKCTPRQFHELALQHGFKVEEMRLFYFSNYFMFFFPLYFVWRIWIITFKALSPKSAAEAYSMVLVKE